MAQSTPQSTPPPAKGGNAAYVVAALIMLALMAGLIVWKLSGDEKPVVQQPPPPPTETTAPVFEQPPPPPPPPPPETPDAGKSTIKRVAPNGGGCAGECKGQDSAALRSALAGKAGAARGCYERALRNNPTLSGRLVVNVRVGPGGQVCSAGVASNPLGDQGVASCVVGMFRSASFPAPQGGCVDAQVPMNFIPKGGAK